MWVQVGCDRSASLVQICIERGFQAFVSDALDVPLRGATCDACISIAVIHHFSTQVGQSQGLKGVSDNMWFNVSKRNQIRFIASGLLEPECGGEVLTSCVTHTAIKEPPIC